MAELNFIHSELIPVCPFNKQYGGGRPFNCELAPGASRFPVFTLGSQAASRHSGTKRSSTALRSPGYNTPGPGTHAGALARVAGSSRQRAKGREFTSHKLEGDGGEDEEEEGEENILHTKRKAGAGKQQLDPDENKMLGGMRKLET